MLQVTRPDRSATTAPLPPRDAAPPSAAPAPTAREPVAAIGRLAALGRRHIAALGQPLGGGALAAPGGNESHGDGAAPSRGPLAPHTLVARQSAHGPTRQPADADQSDGHRQADHHDDDDVLATATAATAAPPPAEPEAAPDSPALLAGVIRAARPTRPAGAQALRRAAVREFIYTVDARARRRERDLCITLCASEI